MVCRNKDKAEVARAEIIRESGNPVSLFGYHFVVKTDDSAFLESEILT